MLSQRTLANQAFPSTSVQLRLTGSMSLVDRVEVRYISNTKDIGHKYGTRQFAWFKMIAEARTQHTPTQTHPSLNKGKWTGLRLAAHKSPAQERPPHVIGATRCSILRPNPEQSVATSNRPLVVKKSDSDGEAEV